MQGRARDRGPGDEHGFENCEGCDPARASDVDLDVGELGGGLLGRVLVGDRPPRRPRGGTEAALHRDVVDLDHDSVDLVLDVVAVLAPVRDLVDDLVGAGHLGGVGRHRQTPGPERQVGVVQRLRSPALRVPDPVTDHPQLATGRDLRILLPQRAGGRVARIRERRLALRHERGVERLEVLHPEEDLATDLEDLGNRVLRGLGQAHRDVVDGARVQ